MQRFGRSSLQPLSGVCCEKKRSLPLRWIKAFNFLNIFVSEGLLKTHFSKIPNISCFKGFLVKLNFLPLSPRISQTKCFNSYRTAYSRKTTLKQIGKKNLKKKNSKRKEMSLFFVKLSNTDPPYTIYHLDCHNLIRK